MKPEPFEDSSEFVTAQEVLAAIVSSADDAIYSKDRDALIRSWNRAAEALYGYTEREALGQPVAMLVPDDHRNEERVILQRILKGESVNHYETKRRRKDGTIVAVSLTVSPLRDPTGRIVGASVIARNIEDRRKAESMQQQLERQEFVNMVAHELRSPLAAITGASDLLSGRTETLSEQGETLVEMIARQTRIAQSLINDLLDLSRIQSSRFEVNLMELSLAVEVNDVVDLVPPPEGKRVNVHVSDDLTVVADHDRLRQVLTNLLGNAYKYGGDLVEIEGRSSAGSTELIVRDNGPGLSDEVQEKAFEPFVRGRSVSRERGSGLGLSISKALMEAFDGTIRYEPAAAGGASFVCTFHSSFSG